MTEQHPQPETPMAAGPPPAAATGDRAVVIEPLAEHAPPPAPTPSYPVTPPSDWGDHREGPGSPIGSIRPPDTTGTSEPAAPVPTGPRLRDRVVGPLAGAMVGAIIATAATLAAVRTLPAYRGTAGPVISAPVVDAAGDGAALGVVPAVAEAVTPSVVRIAIVERQRDPDDPGSTIEREVGNGSGVIYRSDGYILTNNHVVADADALIVQYADGEKTEARVVGTDALNDLAVIKVEATGLPAIQVRGETPQVGELAVAIGSPFGLDQSVTTGIVSGLNREIDSGGGADAVYIPNVIQTDAAINPGNSGGALVDAQGRLIGINTAILSATRENAGIGFAIPSDVVIATADQLIVQGFVRHAFLGIQGFDLNPLNNDEYGVAQEEGVVVDSVVEGTGAEAAGLGQGDIILEADGKRVTGMRDLIIAIRGRQPGDTMTLRVIKEGGERLVEVELSERPR